MSIDLTGLFSHDVEIYLEKHRLYNIKVISDKSDIITEVLNLPKRIWVCKINADLVWIDSRDLDCIALAERIALHCESQGYTVKRVITPLGSSDSKEVQSFILA